MSRGLALAAALLAAAPVRAAGREGSLEHAGSVGVIAAVGPEYSDVIVADCPSCGVEKTFVGMGLALDLGGTVAVGSEGSELELRLRLVRLAPTPVELLMAGYRKYFGRDEFKTFFCFDLLTAFRPSWTGGARAALGGMYELSTVVGVFSELGASFTLGQGRRFGAELIVGVQGRSYLLE